MDSNLKLQVCFLKNDPRKNCLLTIHSPFVRKLLESYFKQYKLKWNLHFKKELGVVYHLQFTEYEDIDWDVVLAGDDRSRSNCYCVRKGLTRKASWAQVVNKWVQKYGKTNPLGRFVPESLCISTWDAFSDDGGWLAKFNIRDRNLALSEALRDAEEWIESCNNPTIASTAFILKPSIASKGAEVTPVHTITQIKEIVKTWQDCREWVLQKYVPNLLLLDGNRKFHLRVFIICIGAVKVHVFEKYIAFFATSPFNPDKDEDHFAHITNAYHQRDHSSFNENHAFKLPNELAELARENLGMTKEEAIKEFTHPDGKVLSNIRLVLNESFRALKSTPAVFQPHPNCFELFGLDFLVDRDLNVHLLEFNSGPDLDQGKGNRLTSLIEDLVEGWFRLGVEEWDQAPGFHPCYSEEWVFAQNSSQQLHN